MRVRIGGIDIGVVLRDAVLADHRLGQPVRVVRIIEAEAALDAEPVVIGRPVLALDRDNTVLADLIGQLTADPAIGTDAVDLPVGGVGIDAVGIDQGRRHQRAGRAGLHAFAAGDAGAVAHRVVEIEDDLFMVATRRHTDHVVDLDFAAGADAEIALDAGVELHRHRRMAAVGRRRRVAREAAVRDAERVGPLPEPGSGIVRRRPRGLVPDQQLEHHLARKAGALARGLHLHAWRRLAHAGRGEHALAFDLDHAGAAIAVGAVAGFRQPAEMRDLDALPVGNLPDRLARFGRHLGPVEKEADRFGHREIPSMYVIPAQAGIHLSASGTR